MHPKLERRKYCFTQEKRPLSKAMNVASWQVMLLILPKATFHSLNTASADTGSFFSFPKKFQVTSFFGMQDFREYFLFTARLYFALVDK
jgi:hypothetical protein